MSQDQFPSDPLSSEGTLQRLFQVAIKGAEYDSRERQPHPKCLDGTRVVLLNYIHRLLDDREKSRLIWLHGTAGVGKSAVAFTVAERMRGLKMTEETTVEKRLAGTFFFSRKNTKRCTTGYFFATLACQLATNFPSVRKDVNRVIRENPALLDPDKSLRDQMEALFLQPLRKLRFRLRECPPLVFVVDALDECTSETELADLISLLGHALREPDLPVTHILLTSRSEEHIREAIEEEDVRALVWEIPVKTSGEGGATIISLDGVDVDNDICIFLEHSFAKLRRRYSNFPQPRKGELMRLASRAGRRFIVASTMMKFIDDGYNDPRDRLQLMLELTSELLPGTEVYKLYDRILATCTDPTRAYLHLSVVAALADPLPMSEISKLLGPGEGRDVEKALVQLRSVMDIPSDNSLPVNIYHSSVRDYISNPSNCSLPQAPYIIRPHSLLAHSSLRLMMHDIPESTALLDALSNLRRQSKFMLPHDPQFLRHSLAFIIQPPEPLQVLICLLWLRGDRDSDLHFWLETLDGRAWLETQSGGDWLQFSGRRDWLVTRRGQEWIETRRGQEWMETLGGRELLETESGHTWLETESGQEWLKGKNEPKWLQTLTRKDWLLTESGRNCPQTLGRQDWLLTESGRNLLTESGMNWLQTESGRDWLQTESGRDWLLTLAGQDWLLTESGRNWLQSLAGQDWLLTESGRNWLQSLAGQDWLQSLAGQDWLLTESGRNWLQTLAGQDWLLTESGRNWLQSLARWDWLLTESGRNWLLTESGRNWLQTPAAWDWLQTLTGQVWLLTENGRNWLQTLARQDWLLTGSGRNWLQSLAGQDWLLTESGRNWLQTESGRNWLQTPAAWDWLLTESGRNWLQTPAVWDWLQTLAGQDWLLKESMRNWQQTRAAHGRNWLQTPAGWDWLQTLGGQDWLQTQAGQNWLQRPSGRSWLQTQSGQDWLQTPHGQAWQSTPTVHVSVWMTMEEFSSTMETINEYIILPELPSVPLALQAIQQFRSLPDFLIFPAFVALRQQDQSTSASPQCCFTPDMEIIHAIKAFASFADEAGERSRTASNALKYACQYWAFHLSRAPDLWDDKLNRMFKSFWNRHLLSWLERQWCLKGLRSCLAILSEGEKLAKEHVVQVPGSSQ